MVPDVHEFLVGKPDLFDLSLQPLEAQALSGRIPLLVWPDKPLKVILTDNIVTATAEKQ